MAPLIKIKKKTEAGIIDLVQFHGASPTRQILCFKNLTCDNAAIKSNQAHAIAIFFGHLRIKKRFSLKLLFSSSDFSSRRYLSLIKRRKLANKFILGRDLLTSKCHSSYSGRCSYIQVK